MMSSDSDPILLPPDRAKAVEVWLSTSVGTCRLCGQPVYPTDPRRRDPDELDEDAVAILHLPCLQAAASEGDDQGGR